MGTRNQTKVSRTGRRSPVAIDLLERRVLLSAAIAAFADEQTFLSGSNPLSVTLSDVNRDGKLDAIVANNTGGTVSVMLNDGTGQFPGRQAFPAGTYPASVAAGDLNGDGKPDLVVADFGGTLSVLTGNGDGTFSAPQPLTAGSGPIGVTIADINGDGHPDLLAANYSSANVTVLLGNGNGSFSPAAAVSTGLKPISVTTADLNGDGKLDLAVTNYGTTTVSVMVGNGNGAFAPRQTFTTGGAPRSVVAADMNRDGKLDLVVSSRVGDTVGILLGNGNATFASQQSFATGTDPRAVAVADVNVDGKLDVVVPEGGDGSVAVFLGNGNGTLQSETTFGAGNSPYWLTVGDVNGDGRPDIVVANRLSNNIGVLIGDVPPKVVSINRFDPPGPITSDTSVSYAVAFDQPVTGVDPTDFALSLNGVIANNPVTVIGGPTNYSVTVNGINGVGTLSLNLVDDGSIQNAANNTLQPGVSFGTPQTTAISASPSAATAADVNGDGLQDFITTDYSANRVSVFLGNGDGTFQPEKTFATGARPMAVLASDLNGDGKLDLAVANGAAGTVGVLLGNGNGSFQPQIISGSGPSPYALALSDLNGDGVSDLVVANTNAQTVSILIGAGGGTFSAPTSVLVNAQPYSLAAADMNGDGKRDIVVGVESGTSLLIMLGNGNGTFTAPQTIEAGTSPRYVAVADLNRDGKLDIAVANSRDGTASILLGNGDATFAPQVTYSVRHMRSFPDAISIADLNGDGAPDVIVNNSIVGQYAPYLAILQGNGGGTFLSPTTLATNPYANLLVISDLTGDGRPDIALAAPTPDRITLLPASSNANFSGQTYQIVPSLDSITGTPQPDPISLAQDPDHTHIDWTIGTTVGQMLIADPNGLTIHGAGGHDTITFDYSNGNPLPNTLHLDGTFTLSGLAAPDPLAGVTLDIASSTIYFNYMVAGQSPAALIRQYLINGYNGGAWNGNPTPTAGVIISTTAASGPPRTYGIGYADWIDGAVSGQPAGNVELRYTVLGDANLDRTVNSTDAITMARNYLLAGKTAWDLGNFNYDSTINLADATLLQKNFNATATGSAAPAGAAAVQAPPPVASTITPPPAPPKLTPPTPVVVTDTNTDDPTDPSGKRGHRAPKKKDPPKKIDPKHDAKSNHR